MSAQHTPGRLKLFTGYSTLEIRTQDDAFVAHTAPYTQANARRLVACWNACEGIQTYSLESNPGLNALAAETMKLMDQRDELLSLLSEVSRNFTREDDLPDDLLPRIDAAIAKAGGEV